MAVYTFDNSLLVSFLKAVGIELDLSTVTKVTFTFDWEDRGLPAVDVEHVVMSQDLDAVVPSTERFVSTGRISQLIDAISAHVD